MQEEFLQDTSTNEDTAQVLFEMEELREQSTKQFRLSDGSILAAQYGMDVHYESEDGEWTEIDNRFFYESAENEEDFAGYKSAEGAVEFKFAPQVQEGELVKLTYEDYEVGFELLPPTVVETYSIRENDEVEKVELSNVPISFLQGEVLNVEEVPAELATTPAMMSLEEEPEIVWADVNATELGEATELLEGTKAEDAVTSVGYGNVLPGVSLQYVLSGSSLKEYILVNEKSDNYRYDFAMKLANLEPQMQEDGSILLKDAESGETVYEIPAGYMTDAEGAYSDAVAMSIDETGDGNWILNVTADAEWINAEERVFPVQIDPTINTFLESKDKVKGSYVSKGFADMVSENYPNLMVGYDSGQSKQLRTFIKLRNLPNLPKDSVICKAACLIFVENFSDIRHSDLVIRANEVEDDVIWGNQNLTWNNMPQTDRSAVKSVDTVCDIICIEKEGEKLCQVTIQSTQKNLENRQSDIF